jgi:XTP/dITP diphosphohydrolase
MKILAATGNLHKIKEFRAILKPLGIEFVTPDDIGGIPEIEETGKTFEQNAGLKALQTAKFADMYTFADDSGLEVEALNNAPGIYSSRYAPTDEERIRRVLSELADIEQKTGIKNRKARFVCVIAFASPEKIITTFRGEVYGQIMDAPAGSGGFGYDPIFKPDNYSKSFAELRPEEKDSISHRFNALKKAETFFRNFIK